MSPASLSLCGLLEDSFLRVYNLGQDRAKYFSKDTKRVAKINYQKIIQMLAVVLHCPVCGYKYNAEQTSIVDLTSDGEKGDRSKMLVHADCERCKSSVVFSIALNGPEIFSVGMVTDLTFSDVKKFRRSESVTANDAEALHDFLESFDGDFEKVLS